MKCEVDHGFEAWFPSSDGFDEQSRQGLVQCPMCGSSKVSKAIMAPMVRTSKEIPSPQQVMAEMLHKVRQHVESTHDYVGSGFAAEARDMHEGLTPERPIYGEATPDEVKALVDDGVPVAALPVMERKGEAAKTGVQKKLN
nr:DUF1178 family protein [Asticcacaulis solisilvae]